ncbi:MAG: diguanylate cyclase [Desulfobacterales bacterium]|nr:diguanylate cyclase [Desulfobacterales bacterium]
MDLQSQDRAVVLIVDDQPANLMVLSNLLKEDYRILVATNGPKALEIAAGDHPPVLMLLDIEMPAMDGYEVCRRLKAEHRTKGIAVVFVTARDSFEDEEKCFSLGAVDYISKPFHPAIVRARVRNHVNLKIKTDMLEKLSKQDGLTDIPNRRNFEESLAREWGRAMRSRQPLSLVMMDIDHFKRYNDCYGHGAGDGCLRRVARTLKKSLARPTDFVARYGGEEFVALLPDTDADGARHVAEQLRAAVEAAAIPHDLSNTAPVVTLSIGLATHSDDDIKINARQLQQFADQALYRAKQRGRNQVQAG